MSRRLRRLSGRDVAAVFVRLGFQVVATRGSHCKLRRDVPGGPRQALTIPLHTDLATGTLHAIYRQACRFMPESDLDPHFYTEDTGGEGRADRGRGGVRRRGRVRSGRNES